MPFLTKMRVLYCESKQIRKHACSAFIVTTLIIFMYFTWYKTKIQYQTSMIHVPKLTGNHNIRHLAGPKQIARYEGRTREHTESDSSSLETLQHHISKSHITTKQVTWNYDEEEFDESDVINNQEYDLSTRYIDLDKNIDYKHIERQDEFNPKAIREDETQRKTLQSGYAGAMSYNQHKHIQTTSLEHDVNKDFTDNRYITLDKNIDYHHIKRENQQIPKQTTDAITREDGDAIKIQKDFSNIINSLLHTELQARSEKHISADDSKESATTENELSNVLSGKTNYNSYQNLSDLARIDKAYDLLHRSQVRQQKPEIEQQIHRNNDYKLHDILSKPNTKPNVMNDEIHSKIKHLHEQILGRTHGKTMKRKSTALDIRKRLYQHEIHSTGADTKLVANLTRSNVKARDGQSPALAKVLAEEANSAKLVQTDSYAEFFAGNANLAHYFLSNYKNPCWFEAINDQGLNPKLRCLPYVFLAGIDGCGLNDITKSLLLHPDIVSPISLVPTWWSTRRIQNVSFIAGYLNNYDSAAKIMQSKMEATQLGVYRHNKITIDASSDTILSFETWTLYANEMANQSFRSKILTPNQLSRIIPDAKFIVPLCDPVNRIYRMYNKMEIGSLHSAVDFHEQVDRAITAIFNCTKLHKPITECHYLQPLLKSSQTNQFLTEIKKGFYGYLIQDWLKSYPIESFKFIRLEDYISDRYGITKEMYRFLDLGPLPPYVDFKLAGQILENYHPQQEMLEHTHHILDSFYSMSNKMLAQTINQPRFKFRQYIPH